jgi:transposase
LLYSAPDELRQPLLGLKTKALVATCAAMRPGPLTSPTAATKASLRTLARRWQQLQAELTQLDRQLQALVAAVAPALVALPGVGVDTAGQLLVTAGDTPAAALRGFIRPPVRRLPDPGVLGPHPPPPAEPRR